MEISVIGVPIDVGGPNRRGTDMGPSALRYARLHERLCELGHTVHDRGDVPVPIREALQPGSPCAKHLDTIVDACERLALEIESAVRAHHLPLVLGGDHSIAVGTVGGIARAGVRPGIIWIDAHGDFNTPETTPSGNVHGMPLAAIVGRGAPAFVTCAGVTPKAAEETTVLVGLRSLDPGEREALRASRVRVFTMKEIDEMGIGNVMREAIRIAGGDGVRPIHLSIDMDAIDPMFAPGVGTPVEGGLTFREAHLAMELIAESGLLGSIELVEVNPILDLGNRTARLGVDLLASALGRRIL